MRSPDAQDLLVPAALGAASFGVSLLKLTTAAADPVHLLSAII